MPAVQLIRPQNKLDYPSRNFAFDPLHLAAQGITPNHGDIVYSVGAQLVSAMRAAPYVTTGTAPTGAVLGTIGKGTLFNTSGQYVTLSGQSTATPTLGVTMAAICQFTTSSGTQTFIGNGTSGGAGSNYLLVNSGVLGLSDGAIRSSTISIAANTPYFLAVSFNSIVYNFIVVNLATGKVQTNTASPGNLTKAASTGSFSFGNNPSQPTVQIMNGYLAAAVINQNLFLTMPQMRQWGDDPWAFWCPRAAPSAITLPPAGGAVFPKASYQNKFGLPSRSPGFDPSHPAAVGMRPKYGMSIVPLAGGNYVNLLMGEIFKKNSTNFPTPSVLAHIGVASLIDATTKVLINNTSDQATTTPNGVTIAGIAQWTGVGNGFASIIGPGSTDLQFGLHTGQNLVYFSTTQSTSSFTLSLNTPYFVAVSAKASSTVNFVAVNLTNGQILSSATTTASGLQGWSTAPKLGADPSGANVATAYIAAAMFGPSFMSMAQLLQWCADPWAFWYPRAQPIEFRKPATAGNTFSASVTEAASAADAITVLATYKTTLTEAASATDSPTVLQTLKTTLTEAANATDTVTGPAIHKVTLTEAGSASDTETVQGTFGASLTESGAATDTVSATGASAAKKVVGWFKEWDRKRPIPLELLQGILKEQGSPWADEITELYQDAQEKEPESKKQAAALKKVIRKLPEYVLEPIDWGPIVLSLQVALTSSRSAIAIKNANEALAELQRQHREIEEDEEESIMLLLH